LSTLLLQVASETLLTSVEGSQQFFTSPSDVKDYLMGMFTSFTSHKKTQKEMEQKVMDDLAPEAKKVNALLQKMYDEYMKPVKLVSAGSYITEKTGYEVVDFSNDADTLSKCKLANDMTFSEAIDAGLLVRLADLKSEQECTGGRCVCKYEANMSSTKFAEASFCGALKLCEREWVYVEKDADGKDIHVPRRKSHCDVTRSANEGVSAAPFPVWHHNLSMADYPGLPNPEWGKGSHNGTYGIEGAGCHIIKSSELVPELRLPNSQYNVVKCCTKVDNATLSCPIGLARSQNDDAFAFSTYMFNADSEGSLVGDCCYYPGINAFDHQDASKATLNRDRFNEMAASGRSIYEPPANVTMRSDHARRRRTATLGLHKLDDGSWVNTTLWCDNSTNNVEVNGSRPAACQGITPTDGYTS